MPILTQWLWSGYGLVTLKYGAHHDLVTASWHTVIKLINCGQTQRKHSEDIKMSNYNYNQYQSEKAIKAVAHSTFNEARNQVAWHSIKNRLLRKPNQLESFAEVADQGELNQQYDLGTQTVAIKDIVGSMGRVEDFDREFYPRNRRSFNRWMSIAMAFNKGVGLPAVELFKLDGKYFVKDGHHRISVASTHGQTFIDADVTQVVLN